MERTGSGAASLEFSLRYNPPMDPQIAERILKEAKKILDGLGIEFLLYSGICLGAVRDNGFIPWDDDIDLLCPTATDETGKLPIDSVTHAFSENGYFVDVLEASMSTTIITLKDSVRLSCDFPQIVDGNIYAYPMVALPANLFLNPKQITFMGEQFLIPNPPETYLELKYGKEWMIPKQAGTYEKDVVEKIADSTRTWDKSVRVRVLNEKDEPVADADVIVAGCSRAKTDANGYAPLMLPGPDWYALTISYEGHYQVLYMEQLVPDKDYLYTPDAMHNATSTVTGQVGTLGNVLIPL